MKERQRHFIVDANFFYFWPATDTYLADPVIVVGPEPTAVAVSLM